MPQEFVPVHWDPAPKRILCDLPLTRPTGRVRLRRGEKPIPARQVPLHAEDVIEWQIAYRDHQGNPVEMGEMWRIIHQEHLLDLLTMQRLVHRIKSYSEFCDEKFSIEREYTSSRFADFIISWRKHPVFIREVEDGVRIEIEIRHRQRAVGFQAMVFLVIALRVCEPPDLIGRTAHAKERARWSPSVDQVMALADAFSLASRSYREDVVQLLEGRW